MDLLRTPEDRFHDLPDFDYPWHRAEVDDGEGHRASMAYVDVGSAVRAPVLLLHGEPTWSFLYRDVIRVLVDGGHRVVAPDLIGFGRSDKPTRVSDHTYARHLAWLTSLVCDELDLSGITVVGQDWGGLLGLRLAVSHPERVDRIVAANTGLPTGDHAMPEVWWAMRRPVETVEQLDIGRAVAAGCRGGLSEAERRAYAAPFPSEEYKAGPRAMPGLVPVTPDDPQSAANRAAWASLQQWEKPFLVAFSDSDPITGPMAAILRRTVPGTANLEHPVLADVGHFLQEDAGEQLGQVILGLLAET